MKKELLTVFEQFAPSEYLSMSVVPVKKEQLRQLSISCDGTELNYEMTENQDGSIAYQKNGEEITEAQFNQFYFQLYAVSAEKRVEDVSSQLTEKPVLTMYMERTEEYGGPLDIEIVPFDQNYYCAVIGNRANLLVNRQSVNRILELVRKEAA